MNIANCYGSQHHVDSDCIRFKGQNAASGKLVTVDTRLQHSIDHNLSRPNPQLRKKSLVQALLSQLRVWPGEVVVN